MLFHRRLEQAVQAPPRTYGSLGADPGSGRRDPRPPPPSKRVRPVSPDDDPVDSAGLPPGACLRQGGAFSPGLSRRPGPRLRRWDRRLPCLAARGSGQQATGLP
jgi:hypothetical protein